MNITARAQDFDLTEAIAAFAHEQLGSSLERLSDGVMSVDVSMKDTNGPKGGVDKQVLIRVRLRSGQLIALETTHENLYAALRTGAKRTKRAVRRTLRKSRRIEKRRLRDLRDSSGLSAAARS